MTDQNTDPQPTPFSVEEHLRLANERIARSKARIAELMAEREQKIVRRIIARSRSCAKHSDRNTQNPPASAGSKADYAQ